MRGQFDENSVKSSTGGRRWLETGNVGVRSEISSPLLGPLFNRPWSRNENNGIRGLAPLPAHPGRRRRRRRPHSPTAPNHRRSLRLSPAPPSRELEPDSGVGFSPGFYWVVYSVGLPGLTRLASWTRNAEGMPLRKECLL